MIPLRAGSPAPGDRLLLDAVLPPDHDPAHALVLRGPGSPAPPLAIVSLGPPPTPHAPPGAGVVIHVVGASGASGDVLAVARLGLDLARRATPRPLIASPLPREGSPAAALYLALGFERFGHVTTWQADAARAARLLRGMLGALKEHRPDALRRWRDVPLRDADPLAVLDAYETALARLGPSRTLVLDRLTGRAQYPFDPLTSRVLLDGDAIVGFVLTRRPSPRLTEIYAKAVTPRYRRSPADLLLMLAHIDSDPTFTSRVIRFQSHHDHRATEKFAARVAATPLAVYLKLRDRRG